MFKTAEVCCVFLQESLCQAERTVGNKAADCVKAKLKKWILRLNNKTESLMIEYIVVRSMPASTQSQAFQSHDQHKAKLSNVNIETRSKFLNMIMETSLCFWTSSSTLGPPFNAIIDTGSSKHGSARLSLFISPHDRRFVFAIVVSLFERIHFVWAWAIAYAVVSAGCRGRTCSASGRLCSLSVRLETYGTHWWFEYREIS